MIGMGEIDPGKVPIPDSGMIIGEWEAAMTGFAPSLVHATKTISEPSRLAARVCIGAQVASPGRARSAMGVGAVIGHVSVDPEIDALSVLPGNLPVRSGQYRRTPAGGWHEIRSIAAG